jgi:hypothetical protein
MNKGLTNIRRKKKMEITDQDGATTLTKNIDWQDKNLDIQLRISERFGFVEVLITDNATGEAIDLDIQLENVNDIQAVLSSNDDTYARLDKTGVQPLEQEKK